jgi:hypothetical protein
MTFASSFGRVFSPTFQPKSQAVAGGGWWDLNGTITSCVAAYQPKGAASYAASKTDLSGNSNTAIEIDGNSPAWDSSYGWSFNNTNKRLSVGFAIDDLYWSFILRYSGYSIDDKWLCGNWTSEHMSGIRNRQGKHSWANYSYNNVDEFAITLENAAAGISAVAGRYGYWNGVNKVTSIPTDTVTGGNFYVGGRNYTNSYVDAEIQAFAIYNSVLTQTQIEDLTTAMAAL